MVLYEDLDSLNNTLSTRTYISGDQLSSLDFEAFQIMALNPPTSQYPHILRWYNQISALSPRTEDRENDTQELPVYMNGKTEKYMAVIVVKSRNHDLDMSHVDAFVRGINKVGLEWGESMIEEEIYGLLTYKIACVVNDAVDINDVVFEIMYDEELEAELSSFQTF